MRKVVDHLQKVMRHFLGEGKRNVDGAGVGDSGS